MLDDSNDVALNDDAGEYLRWSNKFKIVPSTEYRVNRCLLNAARILGNAY